jgi:hypothetical protein
MLGEETDEYGRSPSLHGGLINQIWSRKFASKGNGNGNSDIVDSCQKFQDEWLTTVYNLRRSRFQIIVKRGSPSQ